MSAYRAMIAQRNYRQLTLVGNLIPAMIQRTWPAPNLRPTDEA